VLSGFSTSVSVVLILALFALIEIYITGSWSSNNNNFCVCEHFMKYFVLPRFLRGSKYFEVTCCSSYSACW
jgi:predicted SPOUT superfamily RNA methylase MTH1